MSRSSLALAALAIAACWGCSTTSGARAEGDAVERIPLQHVDATSTAERLQAAHPDARIIADTTTNTVVVAGTAAEIDEVRRAVTRADRPS